MTHAVRELGSGEQGLRGDAPPRDARAACLVPLDDGGGEPELRAADGADIAGRTTTDEDHVEGSHCLEGIERAVTGSVSR